MFTLFASVFRYLRVRASLLYTRLQDAWDWLVRQARDIQIAAVILVANTVICTTLTYFLQSNLPAVVGMVNGFVIYLYIVAKLAVPVWEVEIILALWRQVAKVLPDWLRRIIGTPPEVEFAVHAGTSHEVVWFERSVGGIIFHFVSTIFMWSEVLLLICAWFPVWENGAMGKIVSLVIMVIFFVATEEFVEVKRWRKRLAIFTAVLAVTVFGPMTLRIVAPGTYDYYVAKYQHSQVLDEQAGRSIDVRTDANRYWRERLDRDELELLNKQREYELDPIGHTWTAEDQRKLDAVQDLKADLRPEEGTSSKGWVTSVTDIADENPWLLLLVGAVLVVVLLPKSDGHKAPH